MALIVLPVLAPQLNLFHSNLELCLSRSLSRLSRPVAIDAPLSCTTPAFQAGKLINKLQQVFGPFCAQAQVAGSIGES